MKLQQQIKTMHIITKHGFSLGESALTISCMENNAKTWRDRARERMAELGITQAELAERVGVQQGAIGNYLTNRREPGLDTLDKIAAALSVDPAFLVYGYLDSERAARMAALAKRLSDDELDSMIDFMEKVSSKQQTS